MGARVPRVRATWRADARRRGCSRGRALRLAVVALEVAACGMQPDPQIAEEFHVRLAAPPAGFAPVPCRGRASTLAARSDMVWLAQDLRARVREFDDMPPTQLYDRMMAYPLLGHAKDYRCIVQDFVRSDPATEPDFLEVLGLVANLYVLKARVLLERGELEPGWAHVVDGLGLYRKPVANGLAEHLTLLEVLRAVPPLLERHPPSAATLEQLVAAVEATRPSHALICAAVRHDLLVLAVSGFRVHFGQREREAMAERFGVGNAMRAWRSPWPGKLGRAEWMPLREAYDAMVEGCDERPLGKGLQRAAEPLLRLDAQHPPTGVRLRMVAQRLNEAGLLVDVQTSLVATLRALLLRESLGRNPTTAELALSFGRRPKNPWDGRYYTLAMDGDALTVTRGPYTHRVVLPKP